MRIKMIFTVGLSVVVLTVGLIVINYFDSKYPEYISDMEINKLWNESKGENITIAFLDSGMHQDLIEIYGDRIVNQYDFVNDSEMMTDENGHGTAMICIATCNYEDTGIYGVAPQAKVMPLRIFDSHGDTTNERIIEAIYFAVDNGADIINMSFGSYEDSVKVEEAIDYAIANKVFVICSAGDYLNTATAFPARYTNTIAVGNRLEYVYGIDYQYIDIFINGEDIESLRYSETQDSLVSNSENGSSVATALFSGIIALKICNMAEADKTEFLNNLIANIIMYDSEEILDY